MDHLHAVRHVTNPSMLGHVRPRPVPSMRWRVFRRVR